jgi:hypothetical protein
MGLLMGTGFSGEVYLGEINKQGEHANDIYYD